MRVRVRVTRVCIRKWRVWRARRAGLRRAGAAATREVDAGSVVQPQPQSQSCVCSRSGASTACLVASRALCEMLICLRAVSGSRSHILLSSSLCVCVCAACATTEEMCARTLANHRDGDWRLAMGTGTGRSACAPACEPPLSSAAVDALATRHSDPLTSQVIS